MKEALIQIVWTLIFLWGAPYLYTLIPILSQGVWTFSYVATCAMLWLSGVAAIDEIAIKLKTKRDMR